MKPLRAKMLRYMERRGLGVSFAERYSEPTVKTYVSWVSQFAQYYGKSPEQLSEDDIGAYLDYLKRERQLSQSSLAGCYSGIKVLWEKVLGRSWNANKLPRSLRRERSRTQTCPGTAGGIIGRGSAPAYLPDKEPQTPGVAQGIIYYGHPGRRTGKTEANGHRFQADGCAGRDGQGAQEPVPFGCAHVEARFYRCLC